jgi:hypothetical protein
MSNEIDFSFPHKFACKVLDELPGGPTHRRHFFPGYQAGGQDGVTVQVLPEAADAWIGTFAFGKFGKAGISRVLSMPDPEKLCVVARGAGYVVFASTPDAWEVVGAIPIIDVRVVAAAGLVVFANYTEMLAYGKNGVKWRTKRLAWDGLKIIAVGDQTLVGEYWDIREERMQRFEVDLATGATRGGVET